MAKKELYGNKPKVEVTDLPEVEQYDYCFNLVKNKDGVRIAIGNKIVSPTIFADTEAAKRYIESKPWGLIVATVDCCIKIINNQNTK